MRPCWSVTVVTSLALTTALAFPSLAGAGPKSHFKVKMESEQEAPVCISEATGQFEATVSPDQTSVDYTLSYDLTPGATIQQAHIHVAQKGVSGGITVWLCQTPLGTPPFVDPTGLSPTCEDNPGTVTGTFTKANVIGPATQGITGGPGGTTDAEFAQLIGAMKSQKTYANVHSNICPPGEVRGQIR
jgi:hypothetical protein